MAKPTRSVTSDADAAGDELRERFRRLARQWRTERRGLSGSELCETPAYLAIIALGPAVLPHILHDLERRADHWFVALRQISGDDPVRPEHWGRVDRTADDWLAWGRAQGLLS